MQVVIVANGPIDLPKSFQNYVRKADRIIAADGGANLCKKAGCTPHILIGDLDSIDPALLNEYQKRSIKILQHPARKDATDLELALDLALEGGAAGIDLFGVFGGRWDMSLSNIMLACQEKYRHVKVAIHDHSTKMCILHRGAHIIDAEPGARVSFLPIGGDVNGISLEGFEYPLSNETLMFGSSRGLSNVVIGSIPRVEVKNGILASIYSS